VEVFQWKEEKEKYSGNGQTMAKYNYIKVWSSELIDSRAFGDFSES